MSAEESVGNLSCLQCMFDMILCFRQFPTMRIRHAVIFSEIAYFYWPFPHWSGA